MKIALDYSCVEGMEEFSTEELANVRDRIQAEISRRWKEESDKLRLEVEELKRINARNKGE